MSEEDRALLVLATDLASRAERAAERAAFQRASLRHRSLRRNIETYNLVVAAARQRYPHSSLLSALPERIAPVDERVIRMDILDVLPTSPSTQELAKITEVADLSQRLRMVLEASIGAYPEGTNVLQALSFDFIATRELRDIAERDKTELVSAYQNRLWKSVILLCGGLAEGMLCDKLLDREQEAQAEYKKQWPTSKRRDLLEWDLFQLTTVASDLGEISTDAARLAHTLRGWRNLVHPGKEARGIIKPAPEEADLAVHMIRLLARDLGR